LPIANPLIDKDLELLNNLFEMKAQRFFRTKLLKFGLMIILNFSVGCIHNPKTFKDIPVSYGHYLIETSLLNPPNMKLFGSFESEGLSGDFVAILRHDSLKIFPMTSVPLPAVILNPEDHPWLKVWMDEFGEIQITDVKVNGGDTLVTGKWNNFTIKTVFSRSVPDKLFINGDDGLRLKFEQFVRVKKGKFFPKRIWIEGDLFGSIEARIDSLKEIE